MISFRGALSGSAVQHTETPSVQQKAPKPGESGFRNDALKALTGASSFHVKWSQWDRPWDGPLLYLPHLKLPLKMLSGGSCVSKESASEEDPVFWERMPVYCLSEFSSRDSQAVLSLISGISESSCPPELTGSGLL